MRLRLIGMVLGVVLGSAAGVMAQTRPESASAPATTATGTSPAQPASQTEATTAPVSPIPLAQVFAQSEAMQSTLRAQRQDLGSNPIINDIQQDLPSLTGEIATRRQETTRILSATSSLDALRTEEGTWENYASTLAEWKKSLTARASALDGQIKELQGQQDTWMQVAAAARVSTDFPTEIVKQVEATAAAVDQTRAEAERRRLEILRLQAQVATLTTNVNETRGTLHDHHEQLLNQLFARESPPIWELRTRDATTRPGRTPMDTQIMALGTFLEHDQDRFVIHGVIFVLLLAVLFWVRTRFKTWEKEEPTLAPAAPVFASPIATAILFALLIGIWMHPQAPRLYWSISATLMIVPAALLIRRLTEPYVYPILYILIAFFFVDQFRTVIASPSIWPRITFLAEMMAAAAFLGWYLNTSHGGGGMTGRRRRVIRWVCRVALVLFVLAFVTNALGYARLGFLLGSSVLRSAYLALLLYAGLAVTDGIVIVILHLRPVGKIRSVRTHAALLRARTRRILAWAAAIYWVYLLLQMLMIGQQVTEILLVVLETPVRIGEFHLSLGEVLSAVVTVWAAFAISRFVRFLLEEDVYTHVRLPLGLGNALSTVIHYVVLVIGFTLAAAALGFPMTQLTILTGAFGVGLGFGLQTIINNFFSGLIVLAERPIRVGDVIEMDGFVGRVTRIGIRATVMRTIAGSEIILPNGRLVAERVINWSFSDRCRMLEIPVNVDPAAAPERVIAILEETAKSQKQLEHYPQPRAQMLGFNAGMMMMQVRVWTTELEDGVQVKSDVGLALRAALTREGIGVR